MDWGVRGALCVLVGPEGPGTTYKSSEAIYKSSEAMSKSSEAIYKISGAVYKISRAIHNSYAIFVNMCGAIKYLERRISGFCTIAWRLFAGAAGSTPSCTAHSPPRSIC